MRSTKTPRYILRPFAPNWLGAATENRQDANKTPGRQFFGVRKQLWCGIAEKMSMQSFQEPDAELDQDASEVIAACLAVHRQLGPGFVEAIYERAVGVELESRGIQFEQQVAIDLSYRGISIGHHRIDLLVRNRLVVELKAVDMLLDVHKYQVRSYLKAMHQRLGLLINFSSPVLLAGVRRVIWSP